MFSKFELVAAGASVFFMAMALYLVQVETTFLTANDVGSSQEAQLASAADTGVVIVSPGEDRTQARARAYQSASNQRGEIQKLVIDDVKIGTGPAVTVGDTVSVHYIGTLQDGTEFDNSRKRGTPFTFTVGEGRVIPGWEQGVVGMQAGGQRVLVIPPELAYGRAGVGPIPGNATLVFAIELLEIEE